MRTVLRSPTQPAGTKPRDAVVRLALGLAQMIGAITAFLFLVRTGVSSWTIGATTITTALTTISVLLFRRQLPPDL